MPAREAIARELARIQAHWPSFRATEEAMRDYSEILRGYDDLELHGAVTILLQEYDGASNPKPKHLADVCARVAKRRRDAVVFAREHEQENHSTTPPDRAVFCWAMIRLGLARILPHGHGLDPADVNGYRSLWAAWQSGRDFSASEARAFLANAGASVDPFNAVADDNPAFQSRRRGSTPHLVSA